MSFRIPAAASLGADTDYRAIRDAETTKPLEYAMYAPRDAVCPPIDDPPYTCHWPEARANLYDRCELTTRSRGGGKFSGGIMNPTKYHHGDGSMFHPGTSSSLRMGGMIRGSLPRPTTPLIGKGKYQYGKGALTKTDPEAVLQTGQTTVRRGAARPSMAMVGSSTYGLGRTAGSIGNPTAERSRGKYTMAVAPLPNANRPIADTLAVEDFHRGGMITRQGCDELTVLE